MNLKTTTIKIFLALEFNKVRSVFPKLPLYT